MTSSQAEHLVFAIVALVQLLMQKLNAESSFSSFKSWISFKFQCGGTQ